MTQPQSFFLHLSGLPWPATGFPSQRRRLAHPQARTPRHPGMTIRWGRRPDPGVNPGLPQLHRALRWDELAADPGQTGVNIATSTATPGAVQSPPFLGSHGRGHCCMDRNETELTLPARHLCDPDGDELCRSDHGVHHRDGDSDLALLARQTARAAWGQSGVYT